jgi:ATP-dependent exoDNAse (exonuclease V) alpha subunit
MPIPVLPMKPRITGVTTRAVERNDRLSSAVFDAANASKVQKAAHAAEAAQKAAISEAMQEIADDAKRAEGLQLDTSQLAALNGMRHNRCSILIGAAGTGKTTTLRRLLDVLYSEAEERGQTNLLIAVATFTGRAAQQAKRALPDKLQSHVSTIHSLLGFAPVTDENVVNNPVTGIDESRTQMHFEPTFNSANQLPHHVIIIDEVSMVPVPLWNQLIDACRPNTRFILIGDIHQLPPVGSKSVMGYAMTKWPVFELTHIHRQAQDSGIITNAHRILHRQLPRHCNDFRIIGISAGQTDASGRAILAPLGVYEAQKWFLQNIIALWKAGVYQPYRDAIIVPKKIEDCPLSTTALNGFLVSVLNAPKKQAGVLINPRVRIRTGLGDRLFAVGDKVLVTENINTEQPPITNGMTGVIESIAINGRFDQKRGGLDLMTVDVDNDALSDAISALDAQYAENADDIASELGEKKTDAPPDQEFAQRQASHCVTIRFDNGQLWTASSAGAFNALEFGYVITCHKAQGGEYPHVFIFAHSSDAGVLASCEWLYTAVTRARKHCFLFTNDPGLRKFVTRQKIIGDTLEEKIASFCMTTKTRMDDKLRPILPDNVEID